MSRLHLFVSSFENPGVNCLGSSSAWAYRPRPNWLLVTDPWASGLPHFCYRPITNSGNKRLRSRIATLTMVFKLGLEAQKHWRRQQGFELIQRSLPVFVSSMVKKTHRPLNLINQFN